MVYGLLYQHIGIDNLPELIRAELRPSGLDGRYHCLNGYQGSGVIGFDGMGGVSRAGRIAPLN
jgi:hypothetical protein